jgi:hypothetical protein
MRDRVFFLGIAIVGALALSPSVGFSQAQTAPTRIPQQIVINGQMASGAYVTGSAGQLQSFTCPAPQQYSTADGNSHGWACYEQTTGVWLLNAVGPSPAPQAVPAAPPAPVAVPQVDVQPPYVVFPRPGARWWSTSPCRRRLCTSLQRLCISRHHPQLSMRHPRLPSSSRRLTIIGNSRKGSDRCSRKNRFCCHPEFASLAGVHHLQHVRARQGPRSL